MKALFKYTFLAGIYARGIVFAVIFVMNLVFIVLGSLDLLPLAAKITAVSLSGVAISVMMIVNIINDVFIIRRMFTAPGAYLYALTPAPRRRILFAGLVGMLVMDVVTMTFSIIGVTWLSLGLANTYYQVTNIVWAFIRSNPSDILFGLWFVAALIAGYLLLMMIIIFCITVMKSALYQKRAGGVLAALLALATVYINNLSLFLLAPFGDVTRRGVFFTVHIGRAGVVAYVVLMLIQAAALFFAASRLMERKLNI